MPSQTKPKSRKSGGSDKPTTAAQNDPRFAAISSDPRYRLPSAKHSRVNVDKRFAGMFKDEDFSKKASVDRYGRRLGKGSGKKELEKFYRIEGEKGDREVVGSSNEGSEDEEEEADDDDEVQAELDRVERKGAGVRDFAREGGFSDSSSDEESSDEDSDDEEDNEAGVVEFPDEQQASEVPVGEVTNRLAVVNLDWDNIRAADLMAVAQSFAPAGGKGVQEVVIYPSEFGKERLEREELEGPPREIFASNKDNSESEEDEEDSDEEEERIKKELLQEDTGEDFDSAKLRQYQLDRLKYYYAVITFDTPETAKAIYDDMDGREYLTTANFFDLRFVPDEVDFDTDEPRDECTKLPPGYKPNDFVTDALTHSKVRLTWDADDTTRKEVQKRAFSRAEIDENDLQAYIGSDSSDNDDDEDAAPAHTNGDENEAPKLSKAEIQRQKMRAALGLSSSSSTSASKKAKESAPVGDMQITFTSGLSTSAADKDSSKDNKKSSIFENDPSTVNETTRERYIRKEKERKQQRKERAKAQRAGADPSAAASDDEEEEPKQDQDLGFDDPFFSNPQGAAKARTQALKAEKAKNRAEREEAARATASQRAELELLMVDDKADASMRHFNMSEIVKAEKAAKRKGRKGAKKDDEAQKPDGADFKIETQDPRFRGLFESHEFAIDPTNPRFQNTEGMKALLEEGRKKRKERVVDDDDDEAIRRREKKKAKKVGDEDQKESGGEDLQKLLARVKAKSKGLKK
ncbi:hypothetical protein AAFC00_001920 [Neodothiora populina]|uniref:NUC153 domain-containing protein n=1 Tax=Neodothiora populina TaxID=2781224 RepID=A0ABR3PQR8_9PEZI